MKNRGSVLFFVQMMTTNKEYNHLLATQQIKNKKPKWIVGIIIFAILVFLVIFLVH